jgi:hypothetical protein
MPDIQEFIFLDAIGGMNGSEDNPAAVGANEYARATNVQLVDRLPTTRPGVIVREFQGADPAASARIREDNIQGAAFFNPAQGQGGIALAASNNMMLISAAGRRYSGAFVGRGCAAQFVITDQSNGVFGDPSLHLAWWRQLENIALCQDGEGLCWVWNYPAAATFSPGYNTTTKPASAVPNGGSVMGYSHGQGVTVVNSRAILVSDPLNFSDLASAIDLIKYTEQVYWNTGTFFRPPTDLGAITAAEILPQSNTLHGQGDFMVHCNEGVFSIDLNVSPRSAWSSTPMVKIALLGTGATGPYAIAIHDGDQWFRSRMGIQTLRSAASDSQLAGDPQQSIAEKVRPFYKSDYRRWLRFASVADWSIANRYFCTVSPIVQGRYRWHRGFVVANVRVSKSEPESQGVLLAIQTRSAWEGLWTMPREAAGVIQFVTWPQESEQRQFALCRGADRVNRLVEFTQDLQYDLLPDGTPRRVSCQLITGAKDVKDPFKSKSFLRGTIFWRNVIGQLDWGVWIKPLDETTWTPWQAGTINSQPLADPTGLTGAAPQTYAINLPEIPQAVNYTRYVQFLIRWKGYATLENLRMIRSDEDVDQDKLDETRFNVVSFSALPGDYDDFEYSSGSPWLKSA